MNLQHLKNITEVERAGSVTKAAANLFMGQPNLSKSIKEVENEIGITVFRRSAKGVYPTPEGARFLSRARAVLEEMDKLESLYKQGNTVQRLSVCVPEGDAAAIAAAEFISTLSEGESVSLECITAPLSRAAANVGEGVCSIAAVRCPHSEEDYFRTLLREMKLSSELLRTGEYKAVFSEKSRLAEQNKITLHDLEGYTEIILSESSRSLSADGKIMFGGTEPFMLLSRIPQGYMISSELSEDTLKRWGLIQREYEAAEKYSEYLIYPIGSKPDEYSLKFISCFKNAIIERRNENG